MPSLVILVSAVLDLSCRQTIDNRILKYLDIRQHIDQPYKILPPEVESARDFDLNITQCDCHS